MSLLNFFRSKETLIKKAIDFSNEIESLKKEVKEERLQFETDKIADKSRLIMLQNKLTIAKSETDIDICKSVSNSIENRMNKREIEFNKSVLEKTKRVNSLNSELNSILKNKEISELFKSEREKQQIGTSFEVIKNAFTSGKLPKEKFKEIRKNVEKKLKNQVHYADCLITYNGKHLVLKRSQFDDMFPNQWCLPGGHVDPNEDSKTAALRETEEETLIKIDPNNDFFEKVHELNNKKAKICYYNAILTGYPEPIPVLNNREHIEYRWVTDNEIFELDLIADLKTVLEVILKPELSLVEQPTTDKIKGGLGDNKSIKQIAEKHSIEVGQIVEQLKMGIGVEMEHTDDVYIATEIAMDHLMESPEYYTKLAEMEATFEDGGIEKGHKYLRKEPDGKGGWNYVYEEEKGKEKKEVDFSDEFISFRLKTHIPILIDNADLTEDEAKKRVLSIIEKKNLTENYNYIKNLKGKEVNISGQNYTIKEINPEKIIIHKKNSKIENFLNTEDYLEKPDKLNIQKSQATTPFTQPYIDTIGKALKNKKEDQEVSKESHLESDTDKINPKESISYLEGLLKNPESLKKAIDVIIQKSVKNDITKHIESIEILKSAYEQGKIAKETFENYLEKAQRFYKDNAENKRLKRVGKPYGSNQQEDASKSSNLETKEKKDNKEPEKTVEDYAKESSNKALQTASQGGDEELRVAAKKELERRETEHKQEEVLKPDKDKNSQDKEPEKPKEEAKDSENKKEVVLKEGDLSNIGIIQDVYKDQYKINGVWYHKRIVTPVDSSNKEFKEQAEVNEIISKLEEERGKGFITLYHGTDSKSYESIDKKGIFGKDETISFLTSNKKEAKEYSVNKAKYRGVNGGNVLEMTIPKWSVQRNRATGEYETELTFENKNGKWYPTNKSILSAFKSKDITKSNESQEQDIKKAIETLELAFIRGQISKEQFEKSMSNYRNKEKSTLTDYHRKRNKIAVKVVEEMSKQPFSAQQLKEQTENVLKMGRYGL